jgi:hypothetical protein
MLCKTDDRLFLHAFLISDRKDDARRKAATCEALDTRGLD